MRARIKDGREEFYVLWTEYPPEKASWEPRKNLKKAAEALAEFEAEHQSPIMVEGEDDEAEEAEEDNDEEGGAAASSSRHHKAHSKHRLQRREEKKAKKKHILGTKEDAAQWKNR